MFIPLVRFSVSSLLWAAIAAVAAGLLAITMVVGVALFSPKAEASISCAPIVPWFCKTKKPTK